MAAPPNMPQGNLRTGDQPRATEESIKETDRGMGKISYVRQAQRGNIPKTSYGTRYMRKS
jgi:hypothetical protein